jgi:opacity protein-like surface antigen
MMSRILLAAAAALVCASGAIAADNVRHRDPNKRICRTIDETGSRLNKSRACHTQAEWDELRRQTKQKIENIQNNRPFNGA